jgi:hypothetical protein
MGTCKTCGKKCDKEYCFQHKPRKPLTATKGFNAVKREPQIQKIDEMRDFFLQLWKKRPHKSEISGDSLGSEPLHVFFHHILPKEKYHEAALDEENIILLTLWEHANVESDMYRYEEVNRRREQLKLKYERAKQGT